MSSIAQTYDISATSSVSFEDAVRTCMVRASRKGREIRGAWVKDQRLDISEGRTQYRVNLHVAFGRSE